MFWVDSTARSMLVEIVMCEARYEDPGALTFQAGLGETVNRQK